MQHQSWKIIFILTLSFLAAGLAQARQSSAELTVTNMKAYLKLTDKQVKAIRPIIENYTTQWQELIEDLKQGTMPSHVVYDRIRQLKKKVTGQMGHVLSTEQMQQCSQAPDNCPVLAR